MVDRTKLGRRDFLTRAGSRVGALMLAGCDDGLSENPDVARVLNRAEAVSRLVQKAVAGRSALAREYTEAEISADFRANGTTEPTDQITSASPEMVSQIGAWLSAASSQGPRVSHSPSSKRCVPDTPEELAGAYVLGCLEADERRLVESRMRAEPGFRRFVDAWSRRLTQLSDRTSPMTPPASVWVSIQRRIGGTAPSTSRRQSDGVWLDVAPGVRLKLLHVNPVTGERTGLMRMAPGSAISEHDHAETEECFVLEGVVDIDGEDYRAGDYTVAYAGSRHEAIRSATGGLLLLHWNALATPRNHGVSADSGDHYLTPL